MNILGYSNKFLGNLDKNIIVYYLINDAVIGIEFELLEDLYIPKIKMINNFEISYLNVSEVNKLPLYFNGVKIENVTINKTNNINEFIINSKYKNLEQQFFLKVDNNYTPENILSQIYKNKNTCFLVNKISISKNDIYISNFNIDFKKEYNNFVDQNTGFLTKYNLSLDSLLKIAKKFNISTLYTDLDYSYYDFSNSFIPTIYISKKLNNQSKLILTIAYFLKNIFEEHKKELKVLNSISDIQFYDITNDVISILLPKKTIEYWMDRVIIQNMKKLSEILNVDFQILLFRLDKLGYGKNNK